MNTQSSWIDRKRTEREERYAAQLHDDRLTGLRRHGARRTLVIVSMVLWLVAVALIWWNPSGNGLQLLYVAVALLAVAGFAILNITVRVHWPEKALDERLVAARNAAYRTAYVIVGWSTGIALLMISVSWQVDQIPFALEPHHLRAVILAFSGAALMMPSAILAWRERDV